MKKLLMIIWFGFFATQSAGVCVQNVETQLGGGGGGGLQSGPATPCITDLNGNCIATPTPPPMPTATPYSSVNPILAPVLSSGTTCNNGYSCSSSMGGSGIWNNGACCSGSGSTGVCLGGTITCSGPAPTATPPLLNPGATCNNGESCSSSMGGHGIWNNGACCSGSGANAVCLGGTITCSAAPAPTATPPLLNPGATCNNGESCSSSMGGSGTWNNGACCSGSGASAVCLAGTISCTGHSAPTVSPVPSCINGDSCSSSMGGSGTWYNGACCSGSGESAVCLAGTISCNGAMPRATPQCEEGGTCISTSGVHGTWTAGCCIGMVNGQQACLLPQSCSAAPAQSSASLVCSLGAACSGSGGLVGIFTKDGCCAGSSCFADPVSCPPVAGGGTGADSSGTTTVVTTGSGSDLYFHGGKCDKGFLKISGRCVLEKSYHACGPASGPATSSSGTDADFSSFVNSKLKCCMKGREFTQDSYNKFDCVENASEKYQDFNALWSSTDQADNGGKMNALLLTNANGKAITGFYTLDGKYCSEFSEFMAPVSGIQSFRISGDQKAVQQSQVSADREPIGTPYPLPPVSSLQGFKNKLPDRMRHYPSSVEEMRRCPVLVRAALVAKCGVNPKDSNLRPVSYSDLTLSKDKVRCVTASSVQVQYRVEQVFQITGQPVLKTIDSVVDQNQMSTISIDAILKSRK